MVPIGVSIGDVIAVSKLLSTIITVLRDSTKATSEYEELLLLLQSLQNTFRVVGTHIEGWSAPGSAQIEHQPILNALGLHIGRCQQALLQLHESLSKYAQPPAKHLLSSLMYEPSRNLQWRLFIQKDARLASERLSPHIHALQVLLGASTRTAVANLASAETKVLESLDDVKTTLSVMTVILGKIPLNMGNPMCGGVLADHVWICDGLGQQYYLPINFCNSFDNFRGLLLHGFRNCPGEERVAKGHFELLDRRFNQKLDTRIWSTHVKPGCQLEMAFVVGSWEKWVVNYCVRCKKKNATGFRNSIECECGLSYEVLQAKDTEYQYEPIDGTWTEEANRDPQFDTKTRIRIQQDPEFRKAFLREEVDGSSASFSEECHNSDRTRRPKFLPWKQEALRFRRMIIVWDPIFNITSRAMMCRCVMGEMSRGSHAPRIDVPVEMVCPRHAPTWWNLEKHAMNMLSRDYSKDPYFDKYGGYDMFRYYAVSTGGPYSSFHLDRDKLLPSYEWDHMQRQISNFETEETLKAARAYEKELYRHSKPWVEKRTKGGRFDPEILQWTREWQQLVEDTRPDIMELGPDEVRRKNDKYKSNISIADGGELELDIDF